MPVATSLRKLRLRLQLRRVPARPFGFQRRPLGQRSLASSLTHCRFITGRRSCRRGTRAVAALASYGVCRLSAGGPRCCYRSRSLWLGARRSSQNAGLSRAQPPPPPAHIVTLPHLLCIGSVVLAAPRNVPAGVHCRVLAATRAAQEWWPLAGRDGVPARSTRYGHSPSAR